MGGRDGVSLLAYFRRFQGLGFLFCAVRARSSPDVFDSGELGGGVEVFRLCMGVWGSGVQEFDPFLSSHPKTTDFQENASDYDQE